MKKIFTVLITALLSGLFLTSCNKESNPTFIGDWIINDAFVSYTNPLTREDIEKRIQDALDKTISFSEAGKVLLDNVEVGTYSIPSSKTITITDTIGESIHVTVNMEIIELTGTNFTISGILTDYLPGINARITIKGTRK